MRFMRATLFAMSFYSCGCASSWAQECGSPPPTNTAYSAHFKDAIITVYRSEHHDDTHGGGDYEGIGGSFGITSDDIKNYQKNMSIDDAVKYVQQEYRNASAQIVAECGYRMCSITSGKNGGSMGSALAAAGLANVCSAAIGGPNGQSNVNGLRIEPMSVPIIFNNRNEHTNVQALLSYTAPGQVKLQVPPQTNHVKLVSPAGQWITLRNGQSRWLKFAVARPSANDCSAQESARFIVSDAPGASASIAFNLLHDRFCAVPAIVTCGSVSPNLHAEATSNPSNGNPQIRDFSGPINLEEGDKPEITYVEASYDFNGHGRGEAHFGSSCSLQRLDQSAIRFAVNLKSHLILKGGDNQSHGVAATRPDWKSPIEIPGDPALAHWGATVSVKIATPLYGRSCQAILDNATIFSLDPQHLSQSKGVDLKPGRHDLELSCSVPQDTEKSSDGAGNDYTSDETISLAFQAEPKPVVAARKARK